MGYMTRFCLSWEPHESEPEIFIKANQKDYYGISPDGEAADECKWYDHEKDMKRLSEAFPAITFILEGEGEEQGDVWKKRFINGEMEVRTAKLVIEDF